MSQESNTKKDVNGSQEPDGQETQNDDEELRRAPRLQFWGLASIQSLLVCDKPCPAKIIDLSIDGCLMKFERPLPLTENEMVELIFSVNRMPFRVRGQTRAVRSETLAGFQFTQLSDRVRRQLEDLVGQQIEYLNRLHQASLAKRNGKDGRTLISRSVGNSKVHFIKADNPAVSSSAPENAAFSSIVRMAKSPSPRKP